MPLVLQAVALGLPVLCDKPLATDPAAAREAVAAAERVGVPLTVYQNRRYDSDFLTVRALVDAGGLGDVVRMDSRMEQDHRDRIPTAGGGVLFDIGDHLVDQVLVLFGPVASVYAEVDRWDGRPGRFFAALRHAGGVVSHLVGDFALQGAVAPRFRVVGTGGRYDVEHFDNQAEALVAGGSTGSVTG